MKKNIDLKEIQNIEISMLKELKSICKKLNINYYLCGGTLLGAVRHKGFIPWDDDIDVLMKREDYEKLENYFKENNNSYKHYKLLSLNLCDDYYYTMMKLIDMNTFMQETGVKSIKNFGVYLDIFPLDGFPDNKFVGKIHLKKLNILKKMNYMAYTDKLETNLKLLRPLKWLIFKFSKILGARRIALKAEKIAKKYKIDNSNIIAYTAIGEKRELLPKKIYEEISWYEFNGEKHSSIKNYDAYLSSMYGDYMKLPPKDKQVTHHKYIAYYKK